MPVEDARCGNADVRFCSRQSSAGKFMRRAFLRRRQRDGDTSRNRLLRGHDPAIRAGPVAGRSDQSHLRVRLTDEPTDTAQTSTAAALEWNGAAAAVDISRTVVVQLDAADQRPARAADR